MRRSTLSSPPAPPAPGAERDAAAATPKTAPAPTPVTGDPRDRAGRNLLFGLLAFQNGFIDREALLGAFAAWLNDKSRSLAQILVERGALDGARRILLEALAAEHLRLGNTLASKRRNAYQAVAASVSDANESKGETKSEGSPLPAVA